MQGLRADLVFAWVSVIVVVVVVFLLYIHNCHISLGRLWVRAKVKAGGRF